MNVSEMLAKIEDEEAAGAPRTLADWLAARPGDRRPPLTLAWVATQTAGGEDFDHLIKLWIDSTNLARDEDILGAIADDPPRLDPRRDAFLAALAEHTALRRGQPVPPWCALSDRFLHEMWFPEQWPRMHTLAVMESPVAFRRRGIFIRGCALDRC